MRQVKKEGVLGEGTKKEDVLRRREEQFKAKALHGQFMKNTEQVRGEGTWKWLKRGNLKKETEGTLMAAQDQAIRTNAIKHRIDKQDVSPLCRLCGEREETMSHVVAECKKLAQKEYKKWRHDKVAQVIHWTLCKKNGFAYQDRWYEHEPERVLENERTKLLWDFPIQTDHKLDHNKPDLVLYDKQNRECLIIDVACPFDTRVKQKEKEKIDAYLDLKREMAKIWKCKKVEIVPIVIGTLGTVPKGFKEWTKKIDVCEQIELMQKACVLGTAKIIRRTLEV